MSSCFDASVISYAFFFALFFWPGRAFCSKKCYGRALRTRWELLSGWLFSDLLCVLLNHFDADSNQTLILTQFVWKCALSS